jgi:hypothetical protein
MPLYVPDLKPQGTHDCRLEYISTNEIRLVPYGGDQIMIGGQRYTIPAGGVSLAPHASLPTTNFYIYAYVQAGVLTLAYGTDAPVNDAYGMPANPNSTWPPSVLVGIVCGGSTGFQMTGIVLGVVSYWNRLQKTVRSNISGSTASTTGVLIGGAIWWINFVGDTVVVCGSGTHNSQSGANGQVGMLAVDGSYVGTPSNSVSGGTGWWCPLVMHASLRPAFGVHRLELYGWVGNPAIAMNIYCDLSVIMDA